MKKEIGVLLFVLVVAIGLSGTVAAADWDGKHFKKDKYKKYKKYKKHPKFKFNIKKQKVWNKQSNSQSNDIKALIINSPGARVTGTNTGINTASTTVAGASEIDDIGDIVFDVVDQAVWNKQSNTQSNKIRALIINSPGAVVSGSNTAVNKAEIAA